MVHDACQEKIFYFGELKETSGIIIMKCMKTTQ